MCSHPADSFLIHRPIGAPALFDPDKLSKNAQWSLLNLPAVLCAFYILYMLDQGRRLEVPMRIASQCHKHALLLLQIAREYPEFRAQAVYLAREWLDVAAVRITCLDLIDRIEKQAHSDKAPPVGGLIED